MTRRIASLSLYAALLAGAGLTGCSSDDHSSAADAALTTLRADVLAATRAAAAKNVTGLGSALTALRADVEGIRKSRALPAAQLDAILLAAQRVAQRSGDLAPKPTPTPTPAAQQPVAHVGTAPKPAKGHGESKHKHKHEE